MNFSGMNNSGLDLDLRKNSGGITLDLGKRYKPLTKVYFGASWDPAKSGQAVDVDTTAIVLDENGKWYDVAQHILFYNNLRNSFMEHSEDDRDGSSADGEDDDEYIIIDLDNAPSNIKEIVFVANIFDAYTRNQAFGSVRSTVKIREENANGNVLGTFKLSEDYKTDTCVIIGSILREAGGWVFKTDGRGSMDDLGVILQKYCGQQLNIKR